MVPVHLQTERSELHLLLFFFLSLQYECGAVSSAVVRSGDGKQLEVGAAVGSTGKDVSKIKDAGEMKMLVSEWTEWNGVFFHQFLNSFSLH